MLKEYFIRKFIDISDLIQNEFERNIQKYGDKIKCRKGCSQCCSQIFRITETDAAVIKFHLDGLKEEIKEHLKEKASEYKLNLTGNFQGTDDYNSDIKFPCPALDENGACMIYEGRPVVCRRFGPPVYDYKHPDKLFACELNFSNGEEIIDNALIPNQTLIGKKWDELKTEFNEVNNLKENASTTIAEAILDS
ncbi:MAG TPA: YkgJ family cysteine cluster protein [Ignavibacteria bacterium]|nr:YkgJ family cysteine cluster protein [Ignavibacteria bacterium]